MNFVLQSVVEYFFADLIGFVVSVDPMVEMRWRTALGHLLDVEKVLIVSSLFPSLSAYFCSSYAEIYSRSYEQYRFGQTTILSA